MALAGCGAKTSGAAQTPSGSASSPAAGSSPAASSGSSGNSADELSALSSAITAAEKTTYKAVYTVTSSGSGASSTPETVTLEQAPPKSLFSEGDTRVISDGTTSDFCSGGAQPTCFAETGPSPLAGLTALFSPQTFLSVFQEAESSIAAKVAGYSVTYSSANYAGQDSECVSVTSSGNTAKYCATKSGILAFVGGTGASSSGSFELTSFSASAPASDFNLPAQVTTLPSGAGIP